LTTDRTVAARLAGSSDLGLLAELEARCFDDPWDESTLGTYFASGAIQGFLEPLDPPNGYALFQLLPGEAELLRIGVVPEARSAGRARRLLADCLRHLAAEGRPVVHLEVRAGNTPARRLYEGLGFEIVGQRRGYYSDGEDALRYRLDGRAASG